jgi:site-specific DNA recombinase
MTSVANRGTEANTAGVMRAAVYVRVSGKQQAADDKSSLPEQEAACRAYVAEQGWELDGRHFYREVFTGAYLDRPQFDRLREAIARREFDRVVVWRFDRFGRDPDERVYLRVEAKRSGVLYVSVTEAMEDTPEAMLVDYISDYAAGWERRAIAIRTQDAIKARVRGGKRFTGCKPRYGYRWADAAEGEKGGLAVYEPEAVIVRRIFEAAEDGTSMGRIASALTEEGIPTPNPGRADPTKPLIWHRRTIHEILHNPVYKGLSVAYRKQAVCPASGGPRKSSSRVRPDEEWHRLPDATAPAIVSEDRWDRVQRRLAVNRERSERSKVPKKDALLRGGFARCGICGGSMRISRNARGPQYRCDNYRRDPACGKGHQVLAHLLDQPVWEAVEDIFANPGVITRKLRREAASTEEAAAELAAIRAGMKDLGQQEANLTEAIAKATTAATVDALTRRLDGLAEQRRGLKRQEADAQLRIWARQALLLQADAVERWCERERAELRRLDYDGKRQRLERLGLEVSVFPPGQFEGRYAITIAPEGFTLQDLLDGQRFDTAFPTPPDASARRPSEPRSGQ